jgi:hypothetical protein
MHVNISAHAPDIGVYGPKHDSRQATDLTISNHFFVEAKQRWQVDWFDG